MSTDQILQLLNSLLMMLGWLAAFLFGLRQQRINTKDSAKLKIYEDIWRQLSILQNSLTQLSTQIHSGPPFILMESAAILGNATKNQQHIWQGQQDALKYLNDYLGILQNAQIAFVNQFLDFWRSLEMWMHVMPELETAIRTLTSEYSLIQDKTNKLVLFLICLDRWQWEKWDRTTIKQKSDNVWQDLFDLSAYAEDLMGLIHNELISPMFKYAKNYRKPADPRCKILTKGGLVAVKKD